MANKTYPLKPREPRRRRGPQGERGPSGGAVVSGALSYPQRKLKEALSGDENKWAQDYGSSEGYSNSFLGLKDANMSDAAVDNALDWGLDPIDLVTLGLGKGSKLLQKAAGYTDDAKKGMMAQGASNYVNDYYGLGKEAPPASRIEEIAAPKAAAAYTKFSGNPVPEASQLALLRKGKGLSQTLAAGVAKGTRDILSPRARATYAETGFTQATQDIMKKQSDEAVEMYKTTGRVGREQQKAVAQAQYARYIGEQSERIGAIHPSLGKLTDEMSNLETALPNQKGTLTELFQKHDATEVTGTTPRYSKGGKELKSVNEITRDYKISEADAKYIEKHVNRVQGNPDLVTVKRPEQLYTGKHKFDVLGQKNHGYRAVESAFKDLIRSGKEVNNETLGQALSKIKNKKGQKSFTMEPAEGGGYWITNGTNASAITEGGINAVLKVTPDGELLGVMNDKHDWLEKVMGLGTKALKKVGIDMDVEKAFLPKTMVGVSPPMYKNVYDSMYVDKLRRKAGPVQPAGPTKKTAKGSDFANPAPNDKKYTGAIQDIINYRPTNTAYAAEMLKNAQVGSGLFGSIQNRRDQ